MNILVANDDGIQARGIHELVNALSEVATVYVCAPESQRSASGHGITVSKPITIEEETFENAEYALKISGTPADCVKAALLYLMKEKPDFVLSGINAGWNAGFDIPHSVTLVAAF